MRELADIVRAAGEVYQRLHGVSRPVVEKST
jgi:hypothetical protein